MGLLDSILGGTPDHSGLSAATRALLLVLAAKAAKDYFGHHQQAQPTAGAPAPVSALPGGGVGGILGSVLGGGQGGAANPGGLGSVLGGCGCPGLLEELEAKTGMSQQALLQQLAHELPSAVDHIIRSP